MSASWDDTDARVRLLQAIRDEPPCDSPGCWVKDKPRMSKPETAYKIAKYAVLGFAILTVVFLVAAMVFGPELP